MGDIRNPPATINQKGGRQTTHRPVLGGRHIGVHQDGLVHISQLSDRFVDSPRDVVKAGAVVQVRVLEVDIEQKRISLSMKSPADAVARPASRKSPSAPDRKAGKPAAQPHTSSPFDVLKALKP